MFGLKDLAQPHVVLVVETSDDLDLLDEALFAILLAIGGFLRKSLHCVLLAVLEALDHVHGGKVAPADLLDGLELLMEANLVEVLLHGIPD